MIERLIRLVTFSAILSAFAFPLAASAAQQDSSATPKAAAPQLPVTVNDVNGNPVTISDVSRIVPLSGDIAEIVWALGLGSNVVGVDVSATYPPDATANLPKIGFERQLSAEGILSLSPTVVIGKEQAGPQAALKQIRAAGIPVVIVAEPQTIDAPVEKIKAVSAALGLSVEGAALATKTQSEIDNALALAATATSKPTVLFLYVRGGGTQLIGGSGSVADAMIDAAGGIDAGVAAGIQGFMPITAEAVVAAQPEYILVPQSGMDSIGGLEAFLKIPGVSETPAAKNAKILAFDDLLLLGMTPRTGEMIHQLALALHPELESPTPESSPTA